MKAEERRILGELVEFIKEPKGLIFRLDERTNNMWKKIEAMEKHQIEQNGHIKEALERTVTNTAWRKAIILALKIGVPTSVSIMLITKGLHYW